MMGKVIAIISAVLVTKQPLRSANKSPLRQGLTCTVVLIQWNILYRARMGATFLHPEHNDLTKKW